MIASTIAGERQGHGIRKILESWKQFDWRVPHFEEKDEPTPRLVVTLSMLSLFPENVVGILSSKYKESWDRFTELEKIACILAWTERALTHTRLTQFSTDHPRDVSKTLYDLEKAGTLSSTGQYRSKTYHIPGHTLPASYDVFSYPDKEVSYPDKETSYPDKETSYPDKKASYPDKDPWGRIQHPQFEFPFVESVTSLTPDFLAKLEKIAEEPRRKKRVHPEKMRQIVLEICTQQYVTISALAELLQRKSENLRVQYLVPMKNEGKLEMAFPRTPTDPNQAYIAS